MNNDFKKQLISIIGAKNLLLNDWEKKPFSNGWRYGSGTALAVVKPGNLTELWKVLDLCVKNDLIIIMQAANTGLTGGSTPYGSDYDREVIIINTLRIDKIHLLNNGNEILALAGSTLYDLEKTFAFRKGTSLSNWFNINRSINCWWCLQQFRRFFGKKRTSIH